MSEGPARRVVLVSGLSGAGKATILRTLEDLGYEAVDNPPLEIMNELIARAGRRLAIGIDARTRGFVAGCVLDTLGRLRRDGALRAELVFAAAEEGVLLRRFTETRRRHPLAPAGRVIDGIAAEIALTAPLRDAADLVVDTTDLPVPELRRLIEQRLGGEVGGPGGLTVSLVSFAFPQGLPREADMVFDARFLRNPHYVPELRPRTGLEPDVAAYVESDPDFAAFFERMAGLIELLLPRFVQEGKKYLTIAIGCTGGRHRSVRLVERLAARIGQRCEAPPLDSPGWRVTVTHRELAAGTPVARPAQPVSHIQAQEA